MPNLFLDFDGTLLDCRNRLYNLLSELAPVHRLSLEEYWHLKRSGVRQAALLQDYVGLTPDAITEYSKKWLAHIEDEHRLDTDLLFTGLESILRRQSAIMSLHLATNRQFKERVVRQISRLGLTQYFRNILVTEQRVSKAAMIKEAGIRVGADDVFIGDTGEDMLAARELGCQAIAVCWGFQSKDGLACYKPDFIAETIEDLEDCPLLSL